MNKPIRIAAILAAGALVFWAGMQFQQLRYDDICLDIGGGSNPGGYPICVVEQSRAGFSIGPVRITADDVIEISRRDDRGPTSELTIRFTERARKSLQRFTEKHVGQDLDLLLNGRVLRSVRIAEPLSVESMSIPAISDGDAEAIIQLTSRKR